MSRTIAYLATLMQAVPVLTAVLSRHGFAGPRRWIAAWCLLGLAGDATLEMFNHINNLWVIYLVVPLMGAVALYAMAAWQNAELSRIAIWLMIPLSVAAWFLVLLSFEDWTSFSLVVEPMYDILCLGAALFTMGARGLREDTPLVRQDWFWLCGGLAVYYGAAAGSSPLLAAVVRSREDLAFRALTLVALLNIVAYVLLTIGFACRPTPSGVSSPPSPSAWRSWWSLSERPS
jgi:hypothetical protein